MDTFDPTKVIISLANVTSTSFIANVFEMFDLNGNSAENIFYQFNCDFDLNIEELNINYTLFPNPNEGVFVIELYKKLNTISIFDIKGKLILNKELPAGKSTINIGNPGFYYIEINTNEFLPLIVK